MWRDLFERNPAILLLIDPLDERLIDASETAARFYGYSRDQLRGMRAGQIGMQLPAAATEAAGDAWAGAAVAVDAEPEANRHQRAPHRLASGEVRIVDVYAWPVRFGERMVVQAVVHDVTEHATAEAERNLLATAIDQVAESVVIADPGGHIVYVNPAFERVTGYTREAVLGANPRILQSGIHTRAFYAAMWATLRAGCTWHGELVNRRRDGTLFTEEASITPVFDEDGSLLHYVGVKRDVTAARAIQTRLDSSADERAAISAMVSDLIPGTSPEETARAICERLLSLPGLVFASLATFAPGDRGESLASVGIDRVEVPSIHPHGAWSAPMRRRTRHLRNMLVTGPAIEPWSPGNGSPMGATFARLEVTALALAPLRSDGELIGFVQVGASGPDAGAELGDLLPTLNSFAIVASLLLGPMLAQRGRETQRHEIWGVIERRAYRAVFQPIVAMASGHVVGFEALTRFTDGTRPDERFAAAAAAGLGVDLELATLETAITAAALLPHDAWLDLNVSPALLRDPTRLAYLLWKAGTRRIVLEITEHEAIDDYVSLRRALDELGLPVRLAVDDAGAGFASLRHILELRPDIIKLDRSLIAAIDSDPVRQGLVAGL
jgi:PAS domain S-box-containing protein